MSYEFMKDVWPEWRIVKVIGRGSFGTVYEAARTDHSIESRAAIKVISIPQQDDGLDTLGLEGLSVDASRTYYQEIVEDFVKEIGFMEKFKGTQNIVSVEDYKVVEKKETVGWDIYIRMELLTPFVSYASDKKLSESDVIRLGIDLCSALELCGRDHVVHRDIKPENVFVNKFGSFKLGDFGIARKLENLTYGLSQKGTFSYMAPEVEHGQQYDATVDLYSLGLMLYQLLNKNRMPFLDVDRQLLSVQEREEAIRRRMAGEGLTPPCEASAAMAEIVLKACSPDPKERFSSPEEMKKALLKLAEGSAEEAKAPGQAEEIESKAFSEGEKTPGKAGTDTLQTSEKPAEPEKTEKPAEPAKLAEPAEASAETGKRSFHRGKLWMFWGAVSLLAILTVGSFFLKHRASPEKKEAGSLDAGVGSSVQGGIRETESEDPGAEEETGQQSAVLNKTGLDKAIQKAAAFAEDQEYHNAFRILNTARDRWGVNEDLLNALSSNEEEYVQYVLDEYDRFMKEEDYKKAIGELGLALVEFPDREEFNRKLTTALGNVKYMAEYTHVLKVEEDLVEAEDAFLKEGPEKAIAILTKAKEKYGNNEYLLKKRIREYQGYIPLRLFELDVKYIAEKASLYHGNYYKDKNGQDFRDPYGLDTAEDSAYVQYALDQKYDRLSGRVCTGWRGEENSGPEYDLEFSIYGDDMTPLFSETLEKDQEALTFDIDISDVSLLTISILKVGRTWGVAEFSYVFDDFYLSRILPVDME